MVAHLGQTKSMNPLKAAQDLLKDSFEHEAYLEMPSTPSTLSRTVNTTTVNGGESILGGPNRNGLQFEMASQSSLLLANKISKLNQAKK